MSALQQAAFEVHPDIAILGFSLPPISQRFTGRADTGQLHRIELEVTRRNGVLPALVRQVLMPLSIFVFLVVELRIPAAELVVRDVAVDLPLVQRPWRFGRGCRV